MGGYAGQFNLGLAAYFGSGVLVYSMIYAAGFAYYVAMLAGGLVAMFLAFIIGISTLRLKGIYFSIGTLALAEALRITIGNMFPITVYSPPNYWASYSLAKGYYLGLGLAIIAMAMTYMVVNSRLGMAFRAIRDDEDAAMATGVNPTKYKILVFAISSFFIGLAGGVFGFYRGSILPVEQFSPLWTFDPLIAACIGGSSTLSGPIWGCILLVILRDLLSRTMGHAHFIVTGGIFILVILFFPGGIIESGVPLRRFLAGLFRRKSGPPPMSSPGIGTS